VTRKYVKTRILLAVLGLGLLAASVLVALAVASWFLGGNGVWGLSATAAALLLIALAIATVKIPSAPRPRYCLLLGYLFVCWGVWTAVGIFWPVTTVEVKGDRTDRMKNEPACPLRVSYAGQVRLEFDRPQECSFQFRGRFRADQLKIESLMPSGWVRRSFTEYGDSVCYLNKIPMARLYVDNRNNAGVTLACGKLGYRVAANSQKRLSIPALPRGGQCPVTINGKVVGVLQGDDVLVDTPGTRSYRLRTVVYTSGFSWRHRLPGKEREVPPLRDLLPPEDRVFHRGHVHVLPGEIDYFLEPHPGQITVRTFIGLREEWHTRQELCETEP
jgi:hypothetical protein